jgi:hypothetical protein
MSLSASVRSRLQHQHETVHELLQGFAEQQLKQRIQQDKWSVFEQVAHLVSYQPVCMQRLQRMQQEHNPAFDRYVADNDPAFLECCKESLNDLLRNLQTQRLTILNHLMTLPAASLTRTGRHPKYGEMTIVDWTEFFLLHEAHHLFSIFMLIRTYPRP